MARARRRCRVAWPSALIVAVVLLVSQGRPKACAGASHTWRVVIGWSEDRPTYVELALHRFNDDPDHQVRWKGKASLEWMNPGSREAEQVSALEAIDVESKDLDAAVARAVKAGLAAAVAALPGFVAAGLPRHQGCDFRRDCGALHLRRLGVDGLGLRIDGVKRPLRLDFPADDFKLDENDPRDGESTKEILDAARMSQALVYERPGGNGAGVLVVDVGDGELDSPDRDQALWPPCGCAALTECAPIAPTAHHGVQYELVIPIPQAIPRSKADPSPATPPPSLPRAEIDQARRRPPQALRTDGIYVGAAACGGREAGWRRTFLRFSRAGKRVQSRTGNLSPRAAFDGLAADLWNETAAPEGRAHLAGRRLTLEFLPAPGEEDAGPGNRRWVGTVGEAGRTLTLVDEGAGAGPGVQSFVFVPVSGRRARARSLVR